MTGSQIVYSLAFGIWVLFTSALISGIGRYGTGTKPMRVLDLNIATRQSLMTGLMLFGAARAVELVLEMFV